MAPGTDPGGTPGAARRWLLTLVPAHSHELAAMLWSAALFFTVLCSYYVIRPLRESLGLTGGVKNLPWMFTATFVAMLLAVPLFSWMVARWPRQVFIPLVYRAFAAMLLGFFVALQLVGDAGLVVVARMFFVFAAVFALFVVSVFWGYMADLWRREQGERLFGFIAAGGTAGALAGPLLTGLLAPRIGTAYLLLVATLGLEFAARCVGRLGQVAAPFARGRTDEQPIGGGLLAGFTLTLSSPRLLWICSYVLLLAITGTFFYFEQMTIVEARIADPTARTVLFADIDLAVNVLTLVLQSVVLGRVMPRIGLAWTLAVLPLVSLAGFLALGADPLFAVIIGAQILRRSADYAVSKPAREVLFTLVDRESRYKAKNFIDTAVYRGGDALSAWMFQGLRGLGLGLSGLALLAAPIAALWAGSSLLLGRLAARGQDR